MNFQYCDGMVYIIKKGDTLYSLSRRYNTPLALILRANPYVDMYNLQVGDEICIPVMGGTNGPVVAPGPGPHPFPTPSLPSNGPVVEPGPGPFPFPTPSLPSNGPVVAPGPGPFPFPTPSLPSNGPVVAPGPGPLPLPTPVIPVGGVVAYVIRDQDTIRDILDRFGIEFEDLIHYNNLNGMMLRPGMTINIPMYPNTNF